MDKIFSGKDRAKELKLKNYREMTALFAARNGRLWNGSMDDDLSHALYARVDAGRWMAECECKECFFVEPEEPFAYCARCGNLAVGGKARLVIFPENKSDIETALLEREISRPVKMELTTQDIGIVELVYPKYAPRNWEPGRTAKEIREETLTLKEAVENEQKIRSKNG